MSGLQNTGRKQATNSPQKTNADAESPQEPANQREKHGKQMTPAAQESNAHTISSSQSNKDGRTNWKKEGHHTNKAKKPTDAEIDSPNFNENFN